MIFKKAQLIACVLSLAGVFAVTASVYSFGSSNGAKKVQTDRSLEEGRAVVQELRAALGQCAKHAGTLSTQIATDRNLYE